MANIALPLSPEQVNNDQRNLDFFHEVSTRIADRLSFFGSVLESPHRQQAFVSSSPEEALQWICQRVTKHDLLQAVTIIYNNKIGASCGSDDDGDVAVPSQGVRPAANKKREAPTSRAVPGRSRSPKRQKMRLPNQVDVASNAEEQRYEAFIRTLPGLPVDTAAGMIAKAAAIATSDCLRDWKAILKMWRAQHSSGKLPNTRLMPWLALAKDGGRSPTVAYKQSSESQLVLSQSQHSEPHGLSAVETRDFKKLFLAAQKSHAAGIVGDMRHRWIMAAMYSEYESVEIRLRQRTAPSSGRGRGFATVAREQLFASVYATTDGSPATRARCATEWKEFGHWLDYGKRWSMLHQKFGLGIFALLPRSSVTNTYVERTLSITRFADWVEMIATCNEGVYNMAAAIEPLYIRCMTDSAPPSLLCLERLEGDKLREVNVASALRTWSEQDREVHEVFDEPGESAELA